MEKAKNPFIKLWYRTIGAHELVETHVQLTAPETYDW
jgi:hypothetical protein